MILVLDSEAVSSLADSSQRGSVVRAFVTSAIANDRDVVVPAIVLAELYRDIAHTQRVDSMLAQYGNLAIEDTTRALARYVARVLSSVRAGSEDMVDAHSVAVVAKHGNGVILTGDENDMLRLAAAYAKVIVEPI